MFNLLTKILAGALAALLLAFGGYYFKTRWTEAAYKKQVKQLQEQNLALDTEVKGKDAALAVKKTQTIIVRRGKNAEEKVDQVISSHDDIATRELFRRYGLLPQGPNGGPSIKPRGSPGH